MTHCYLRLRDPEIPGDSTAPGPVGEIELVSWGHSFAPDRAAGHEPFRVVKHVDRASHALLEHGWSSKRFGSAILRCYDRYWQLFLTVTLESVVIDDIAIGSDGGQVTETLTLGYGRVTYTYVPRREGEAAPSFTPTAR